MTPVATTTPTSNSVALDALSRIAVEAGDIVEPQDLNESADRRMESTSHFSTDLDRVDARWDYTTGLTPGGAAGGAGGAGTLAGDR